MKINLNWLADLVDLQVDVQELTWLLGKQLGEIESVSDYADKYKGILIVKVLEFTKHPQADRLSLCWIDDAGVSKQVERDDRGLIQVVCGATNLKKDMLACWLPPGTIVPASWQSDKPQQIAKASIRGQDSYGMLASEAELDLGVDQEGIVDLQAENALDWNRDLKLEIGEHLIGKSLAQVSGLSTTVLEIENKMFSNRPDCFGLLGVAREIAAITNSPFKRPNWYYQESAKQPIVQDRVLKLEIDCPQLVPRLRVRLIDGLKVQPSPWKVRCRLASIGIKPVNNIVDVTNYMMYLSGQPSHAFDYDKLLKASKSQKTPLRFIIRQSRQGETLRILGGKQLLFKHPSLLVCGDKQAVALAGIIGGADTEIDKQTKRVLLECASFNRQSVRRSSMRQGIFSEAVTRFSKNLSPYPVGSVADQTAALISKSATGRLHETVYELSQLKSQKAKPIEVSADFINQRLGCKFNIKEIEKILNQVEFETKLSADAKTLQIQIPFWRSDIAIPEDIVEETGRLLHGGYQSIRPILPRRSIRPRQIDALLSLKTSIRRSLAARGANEVLTYSFVSSDLLQKHGQDPEQSFHLLSPLNPQLEVYRQSLTPSLDVAAHQNSSDGHRCFALFEIGCSHRKTPQIFDSNGLPLELQRTALISCDPAPEQAFYRARRYADVLAQSLQIQFKYQKYQESFKLDEALIAPFDLKNSAVILLDKKPIGILGLLSSAKYAAWEIQNDELLNLGNKQTTSQYQPLSRFPSSSQDLTLAVDLQTPYSQIEQTLLDVLAKYNQQDWQIKLSLFHIFQPKSDANVKHLSFRIRVSHLQKTVSKQEMSEIISALIQVASDKYDAKQVA